MDWIDAFNHRDLDRMLARLADSVVLHPLRLGGVHATYRRHEGVTEWFEQLQHLRHEHQIVLSQLRTLPTGQVLGLGSLNLDGDIEVSSFCGLHQLSEGRIVVLHHYLSDPDVIEQLGLIP